jgi:hypothetical protein
LCEAGWRWDLEVQRIGDPVDQVEQHTDLEGILDRLVAHACRAQRRDIGRGDLAG